MSPGKTKFEIRAGVEADLPRVLELIIELAKFEREPDAVMTTVESMIRDGFGPHAVYGFFVGECQGEIVGIALYYYRYSSWRGKCLYLEDLVVTEAFRGKGVGKALFDRTVMKAKQDPCQGMSWQVLDWNVSAIEFYKRYGAELDGQWVNGSLSAAQLQAFDT